jgi:hypothetical protein
MSSRLPLLLFASLTTMLCACDFSDPLSAIDNGDGMVLVDSLSGWKKDGRTICLRRESSRSSCSSSAAEVYISNVPDIEQVQAEWRNGDPKTVDVFVFDGTIEHCLPRSREGGITITLRQLPVAEMPSANRWNIHTIPRLFQDQPDICAASA